MIDINAVCLLLKQTCDHDPDYEELKALLGPGLSDSSNTDSRENHNDMDHVHVEMQRLFQPLGQNPEMEATKAPVLRRVSDRYRHVDAAETDQKGDEGVEKGKPFPRMYPSIRLAMREIQQIQQV